MRRLRQALALIAATSLATAPLQARDWPSSGGWTIIEAANDECAMALEYEGKGETYLALFLDVENSVTLSVTNENWSAKKDQKYDLIYYLDKTAYSGGSSIGVSSGSHHGFITGMESDFLQHFAASTYLRITSKDGTLIDSLDLDGSAAGLATLRRCVAHLKSLADADAREKARFAHIPDDPFAALPSAPAGGATKPVPRAEIVSLFSVDDYPDSALRAGAQGRVAVKLTVGTDGRVAKCDVVSSSGNAALDSATCQIIQRRARFTPARGPSGAATVGEYETVTVWSLASQ